MKTYKISVSKSITYKRVVSWSNAPMPSYTTGPLRPFIDNFYYFDTATQYPKIPSSNLIR